MGKNAMCEIVKPLEIIDAEPLNLPAPLRWETSGLGFMRKPEQADGALTKCSPLGGNRCLS